MYVLRTMLLALMMLITAANLYAANVKGDAFCEPNQNSIITDSTNYSTGTAPAYFLIHPNVKEFNLGTSLLGIFSTYDDFVNMGKSGDTNKFQTYFFLDSYQYKHHIFPSCQPTKFVVTEDGKNKINFRGKTAIFAGGFFSGCLRIALNDFLRNYSPAKIKQNLSIIFPVTAIYENYHIYSFEPLQDDFSQDFVYRSFAPFYEANLSVTFDFKAMYRYIDYVLKDQSGSFEKLFWSRLMMYFTPGKPLYMNNNKQGNVVMKYPENYNVDVAVRMGIEHPPFSSPGNKTIFEKRRVVNVGPNAPTITMYIVDVWGMESVKADKNVDWSL